MTPAEAPSLTFSRGELHTSAVQTVGAVTIDWVHLHPCTAQPQTQDPMCLTSPFVSFLQKQHVNSSMSIAACQKQTINSRASTAACTDEGCDATRAPEPRWWQRSCWIKDGLSLLSDVVLLVELELASPSRDSQSHFGERVVGRVDRWDGERDTLQNRG